MKEIKRWYIQGHYTVKPEIISFNGVVNNIHNESKELKLNFLVGSPVQYSRYYNKEEGIIKKINRKNVIIIANRNNKEVNYPIEELIAQNRYIETYIRLEHKETGIGPFQTNTLDKSNSKLHSLYNEAIDRLRYDYENFPPPSIDANLKHIWNNLTVEERKDYKFACSEYFFNNWFSKEFVKELLNNGFIIKTVQKGYDFIEAYHGEKQVLLKMMK